MSHTASNEYQNLGVTTDSRKSSRGDASGAVSDGFKERIREAVDSADCVEAVSPPTAAMVANSVEDRIREAIDWADPALGAALLMNLQQGCTFLPIAAVRSMCTGEGFVSEYLQYVEVDEIGGVLQVNIPQFKAIYSGICMNASRPELKNMSAKYSTRQKLHYSDGKRMTVRRRRISAKGKPLRYAPQYTYRTKVKFSCGGKVLRKEVFFPVGTQGKKGLEKAKEIKRAINEGMRPIELKNKYHPGCEVLLDLESALVALEFRDAHKAEKAHLGGHSVSAEIPRSEVPAVVSKPLATVGDVVEMLKKGAASLGVDGSVGKYISNLFNVLVRGTKKYQRSKHCSPPPAGLLKEPITILDAKTILSFREYRLSSERDKAKRREMADGLNSVQTQAKAVFSKKAMSLYESSEYFVPRPDSFMAVPKLKGTKKKYRLPGYEVMKSVFDALPALRKEHPDLYVAILLVLFAGPRQEEVAYLPSDAIRKTDRWRLHLADQPDFTLKDYEERDIPLSTELAEHILGLVSARKADGSYRSGYLLEGNKTYRKNNLRRALNKWLREHGLQDIDKPTHELRKWCASALKYLHGEEVAQFRLGHEDPKTTRKSYIDNRMTKEVVSLWEKAARELFGGKEAFVDRD